MPRTSRTRSSKLKDPAFCRPAQEEINAAINALDPPLGPDRHPNRGRVELPGRFLDSLALTMASDTQRGSKTLDSIPVFPLREMSTRARGLQVLREPAKPGPTSLITLKPAGSVSLTIAAGVIVIRLPVIISISHCL